MSVDPRNKDAPPTERDRDEQGRPTLVAQSCLDFLMIEMVPMAQRTSNTIYRRRLAANGQLDPSVSPNDLTQPSRSESGSPTSMRRTRTGGSTRSLTDKKEKPQHLDEDELREATFTRLERIGYRVGIGAVESLSASTPLLYHPVVPPPSQNPNILQQAQPPQAAPLDIIKFLCKDLWQAIFRKQIDNLKTNHRGTFVLTDNLFAPLKRCSLPSTTSTLASATDAEQKKTKKKKVEEVKEEVDKLPPGSTLYTGAGVEEATKQAQAFLAFPVGVVRGALSGLGVDAEVRAEVQAGGLPGVIVTIKTGVTR